MFSRLQISGVECFDDCCQKVVRRSLAKSSELGVPADSNLLILSLREILPGHFRESLSGSWPKEAEDDQQQPEHTRLNWSQHILEGKRISNCLFSILISAVKISIIRKTASVGVDDLLLSIELHRLDFKNSFHAEHEIIEFQKHCFSENRKECEKYSPIWVLSNFSNKELNCCIFGKGKWQYVISIGVRSFFDSFFRNWRQEPRTNQLLVAFPIGFVLGYIVSRFFSPYSITACLGIAAVLGIIQFLIVSSHTPLEMAYVYAKASVEPLFRQTAGKQTSTPTKKT